MKNPKLLIASTSLLVFLGISPLIFLGQISKSYASGVQAGISLDLPNNLFIEGDAFSNYYDKNIIKYNYGFKGNLGYKILGASAYGLGGVQHSGFANGEGKNFKNNTSPLYGFGIGYNLPLLNMGIRLENTYFSLSRQDAGKEHFHNIDLAAVFVF